MTLQLVIQLAFTAPAIFFGRAHQSQRRFNLAMSDGRRFALLLCAFGNPAVLSAFVTDQMSENPKVLIPSSNPITAGCASCTLRSLK
jgi:hypothetical protein